MPQAEFFSRLGLFTVRDFLDASSRAALLAEMRSRPATPADVLVGGGVTAIDEKKRRARMIEVSGETESFVRSRLMTHQPALESRWNLSLTGCERSQFLVYRKGDFYQAHRDRTRDPQAREVLKRRRVSVVVFVNGEAEGPRENSYGGGSLVFYGLIDDPQWKKYGFPLVSEPGLLVAFPSDVVHEVTAVTHGERYTVVSWFF